MSRLQQNALPKVHSSLIVDVVPVPSNIPATRGDVSFQFASIDDRGLICFWLFGESADQPSFDSDSITPEGPSSILVCSRVLSVWSSDVNTSYQAINSPIPVGTLDLEKMNMDEVLKSSRSGPSVSGFCFYPFEPSHFLVQALDGRLLHQSRFGLNPSPPRSFGSTNRPPAVTTCLDFSALNSGFFLAGSADGSVRLFKHTINTPLMHWSSTSVQRHSRGQPDLFLNPPSIVQLQWSPKRPAVFFVLDSSANLHVFDLMVNGAGPTVSEKLQVEDPATNTDQPKLSFVVGNYPSCPSFLAVATGDCTRYSTIAGAYASPAAEEAAFMRSYLDTVF